MLTYDSTPIRVPSSFGRLAFILRCPRGSMPAEKTEGSFFMAVLDLLRENDLSAETQIVAGHFLGDAPERGLVEEAQKKLHALFKKLLLGRQEIIALPAQGNEFQPQ